jgi:transposase-like protein
VFGGVEIIEGANREKRGGAFFAVVVPDRTAATLLPLIQQFVLPGTRIISDGWSAYAQIENIPEQNYHHVVVNHSLFYVDPFDGTHTNTIEGKWNGMKKAIPRQGFKTDKMLQEYLGEQMWRRANKGRLWEAAMEALKKYKEPVAEIADVEV